MEWPPWTRTRRQHDAQESFRNAAFVRNRIQLRVRGTGRDVRTLISGADGGAVFRIEEPCVVSLSGPNQCGKTLLLKMLIGAIGGRTKGNVATTFLDGREVSVRSVRAARLAGIVAVFDQEALLESFTVGEQFLLRHLQASWKQMWWGPLDLIFHLGTYAATIDRLVQRGHGIEHAIGRFIGQSERRRVLDRAEATLDSLGFPGRLDRYPRELSKGAAAAVRITQALLQSDVRVLLLDEALSGVDAVQWPRIVDHLLAWRDSARASIVVVTHSTQELVRWSPSERYVIKDCQLQHDRVAKYSVLVAGIPARTMEFPVFEYPTYKDAAWISRDFKRAIVVVDVAVSQSPPFREFLAEVTRRTPGELPKVMTIEGGEASKTVERYTAITGQLADLRADEDTLVAIVGGGVTLNCAGFAAASVARGRCPVLLMPTTLMAMADVAVGSKVSVNAASPHSGEVRKHALGVYANPSAVVVDRRVLDSLPDVELLHGLSECLKHGLLQSLPLFEHVEYVLSQASFNRDHAYSIALRTLRLKARLLAHDPFESGQARLLLYGHTHAHALERLSGFTVPHGSSVFFGMLVELRLAGCGHGHARLQGMVHRHRTSLCSEWDRGTEAEWRGVYRDTAHDGPGSLQAVEVRAIGHYGETGAEPLTTKKVSWKQVWTAITAVRAEFAPLNASDRPGV